MEVTSVNMNKGGRLLCPMAVPGFEIITSSDCSDPSWMKYSRKKYKKGEMTHLCGTLLLPFSFVFVIFFCLCDYPNKSELVSQ